MRLLLDTHIFLWWVKGDAHLSKKTRTKILNASEVYVSSASIWESTIKVKLNKLEVNIDQLVDSITESGFLELPVTARHAAAVGSLPEIHRDPFDRILIAQAISEPLIFLTADALLADYSKLIEVIR